MSQADITDASREKHRRRRLYAGSRKRSFFYPGALFDSILYCSDEGIENGASKTAFAQISDCVLALSIPEIITQKNVRTAMEKAGFHVIRVMTATDACALSKAQDMKHDQQFGVRVISNCKSKICWQNFQHGQIKLICWKDWNIPSERILQK